MPENQIPLPERKSRTFLPDNFELNSWEAIEPFFEDLKNREIDSVSSLKKWMKDQDEVDSFLSENLAWRYIKYTCNTEDKDIHAAFQFFIEKIQPEVEPYSHELNLKFINSPYTKELDNDYYGLYIKLIENSIQLYRKENIPLNVKVESEARKYSSLCGKMTVEIQGKELTLQQAGKYLKDPDRKVRKEAFEKINERRYQDKDTLDDLFTKLINYRHEIATNAGFENFRDYKHVAMNRFDFTVQDTHDFHEAVRTEIVPLLNEFMRKRKKRMGLDIIRPYDTAVDEEGKPGLKPCNDGEDLINKTTKVFHRIKPELGEYLEIMKAMGHLDLESRKGKSPGGYNYPLAEIGVPFIFMNASGNLRDMTTMVHEGGHAVHSFLTRDIPLSAYKHTPSEVAELASMSMELIAMDHYDEYFESEDEINRAKMEQLKGVLETLPWVAIIDKFQHWIYTNPGHSHDERKEAWLRIFDEFSADEIDWSGYDKFKAYNWQKQMHLYDVPFYYIEYGMAQLGAVAVWKNYRQNPEKGLQQYLDALKLGYTKRVPEIYQTAGISFDFSAKYIRELAAFIKKEL